MKAIVDVAENFPRLVQVTSMHFLREALTTHASQAPSQRLDPLPVLRVKSARMPQRLLQRPAAVVPCLICLVQQLAPKSS